MKVLKLAYYVAVVLFIAWFAASLMDVVADNCFPNAIHHPWNMFVLMTGWS